MKSRFDAEDLKSNNWLRMNGYAMSGFGGERKHNSFADYARLPFPEEGLKSKYKRYLKRMKKRSQDGKGELG